MSKTVYNLLLTCLFLYIFLIVSLLVYCSDELQKTVTSDLRKLLGAKGEPTFVKYVYSIFSLIFFYIIFYPCKF